MTVYKTPGSDPTCTGYIEALSDQEVSGGTHTFTWEAPFTEAPCVTATINSSAAVSAASGTDMEISVDVTSAQCTVKLPSTKSCAVDLWAIGE